MKHNNSKKPDLFFKYKKLLILSVLIFIAAFLSGLFLLKSASGVNVDIKDEAPWMFPAVLEIKSGTKVTWHLKSPAVHPVMSTEVPNGVSDFHSGHFTDTYSHTFDKPGIYVYICPIHPYMKGVIGVDQKVPKDKIPSWVSSWPPAEQQPPKGLPTDVGKGQVWLGAQFHQVEGKEKPGSIIIINTQNWQVEKIITDQTLNNPHNLWEVNGSVVVANWFDKYLSVFDKITGDLEKHVWVGESPAHVHGHSQEKLYVTLQGDDGVAILNQNFDILEKIRTPKGPHGHWMSQDGRFMSLASTEKGSISVWNTADNSKLFEAKLEGEMVSHGEEMHTHAMPLMAGITRDGKYAFTAAYGTGMFYVYNVADKKLIKSYEIGPNPVQVVPSPDGKYVLVPLTGSGEVAVVSTQSWEIVKKIPQIGSGAHGVYYGEKQSGGWYAYISNKFTTWVTVVDLNTLEVAGYIPLPKGAFGGQGILVVN